MSETYLEVHAAALRERAGTVASCADTFLLRVDDASGLDSLVMAGPRLVFDSYPPGAAFCAALGEFEVQWSRSMRLMHERTTELAVAMRRAADRYEAGDLLPAVAR